MESRHIKAVRQMEKLHWIRHITLRRAAESLSLHHGQLPVLEYISTHPGCTQADIAGTLLITPSSIAQSTKRMQRDGLLEKHRQADNRCLGLHLTQKGEEVASRCRECFDELDRDLFAELTDEELATLSEYTERLLYRAAQRASLDAESMDLFAFMKMKKELCNHKREEHRE
jgi:DNA-binding MarR family transcriptional regulator